MKLVIAGLLLAMAGPALAYTPPAIMPIHGARASSAGVTIRIARQDGCTPRKSEFTAAVAKTERGALLLIARKHPEAIEECRAPGPAADILWSFEELGLDPGQSVNLGNPLTVDPGPP